MTLGPENLDPKDQPDRGAPLSEDRKLTGQRDTQLAAGRVMSVLTVELDGGRTVGTEAGSLWNTATGVGVEGSLKGAVLRHRSGGGGTFS